MRAHFIVRLRARCDACGFTLVELMITLAVAAILLMIAVPSFTRMLADTRETSAVNSLVNALEDARNNALRIGQPVTVCPIASSTDTTCTSLNWNTGWGVISTPATGSSVLLASGGLDANGVTVKATGGATPLIFTPRGLVTGLPAAGVNLFTFCDKRGSAYGRSVVVNAGGYVQTSQSPGVDPNGSALVCP